MLPPLKAPFPYFGGKSLGADLVWEALGDVRNYVEPFAGSLAVLLARGSPWSGPETVNDWNCHLVNAWRSIQRHPARLASRCVAPVSEVETEAQHYAMVRDAEDIRNRLGDPAWCDVDRAAWWLKGQAEWIGTGWCEGDGPWAWTNEHGWFMRGNPGKGVNRQLPHLGDPGKGVNRQLPHLGNPGTGVNRKLPHLGNPGTGQYRQRIAHLSQTFHALRDRLCSVRIACGDFERVLGESVTVKHGRTGVFLDPPYDSTEYVYGKAKGESVSARVQRWCAANGGNPDLRIVLAGRGAEHDALLALGWRKTGWETRKGYANNGEHVDEAFWMSPNCERPKHEQPELF